MVTVLAAHFGELEMNDRKVISFKEMPQTGQGWTNGVYFEVHPKF